jgi:hypothetical protein
MRTSILPQTQPALAQASSARTAVPAVSAAPERREKLPLYFRAIMAALIALFASAAQLGAQTPAAQPPALQAASAQTPIPTHKRASAARAVVVPPPADPAPDPTAAPPVPETPKWPANDQPVPASVVWNGQGLRIDASNSSLLQILNAVSTATGAKVEGLSSDQRVFGAFGPGRARDVLSQLLQGSGYNVIMIGDQGRGTPRQILLSARAATNPQSVAKNAPTNNGDDDDADDQPPAPEPAPAPIPVHPGFPPRSPQQIMQEMQQRQQQMQQQQQQPQNNPQN